MNTLPSANKLDSCLECQKNYKWHSAKDIKLNAKKSKTVSNTQKYHPASVSTLNSYLNWIAGTIDYKIINSFLNGTICKLKNANESSTYLQ